MHSLIREEMERIAGTGRKAAMTFGGITLEVEYHGIKWYHTVKYGYDVKNDVCVEEFDDFLKTVLFNLPELPNDERQQG